MQLSRGSAGIPPIPHRTPTTSAGDDEEALEPEETDPSGRYVRYQHEIGTGRFKHVHKGFDEKLGVDVAWSKLYQDSNHLSSEQSTQIVQEMSIGLALEHPNIIKCCKCWEDPETHCINLITEFFTSGNLRDYRQRHKHLEFKAVRRWARQILLGLDYLHSMNPPIIHGDLRCDKLYINGHSGEIKIGDLGLATLLPRRYAPGVMPDGADADKQFTTEVDVFAYGLVVLELASLKKLDLSNCSNWSELLETVADPEAKAFIARCLTEDPSKRPTTQDLLEDPFIARKLTQSESGKARAGSDVDSLVRSTSDIKMPDRSSVDSETDVGVTCEVGTVRGEDYTFQFSGKIKEGKLHFRLHMVYEGSDDDEDLNLSKTIDFEFDPDMDTPDKIATEIGDEFNLSSTDRDICAAALKEWLAKEMATS